MNIHPSAIVHPKAELAPTVEIGPYAIIEEGVKIGKGTKVMAHVMITGRTEIGEACTFFPFASVGMAPQDLKYKGEPTKLIIGNGNTFRESVTLHRGTGQGRGQTVIGHHNFFMAYVHVAHDCIVGDHIIMANAATLGGHIVIGDHAILGGLVGVHQFVEVGAYAMIGGGAIVTQDVPPFVSVAGNRAKLYGLNLIGLKRHGFSAEKVEALKGTYKLLFRSGLILKDAAKQAREKWGDMADVEALIAFVEHSKRGICR